MASKEKNTERNRFDKKFPLLNSLICYEGNDFNKYYDSHPEEAKALLQKSWDFIKNKRNDFPKIAEYFNDSIHDSPVLSTELNGDSFHFCLNDFPSYCFVDALCDLTNVKIKQKDRILPVEIIFRNLNDFSICKFNNNQKTIPLSFKKYKKYIDSYLYSEFKELNDDRVHFGLLFTLAKKPYTILVEIDCCKIEFIEKQEEFIIKNFDKTYYEIYKKFEIKRLAGEYFDYSIALEFIKEEIAGHEEIKKPF
jgi:hypothetical protein